MAGPESRRALPVSMVATGFLKADGPTQMNQEFVTPLTPSPVPAAKAVESPGAVALAVDVPALLSAGLPPEPVYCIYPQAYLDAAREFVGGFPGLVLYAVKANDHPEVLHLLYEGGVRHFDCASVAEIALVRRYCPDSCSYFMVPARLRGAARQAFEQFGVRHFMIDHSSGIDTLAAEVDLREVVVFVRLAVSHPAALQDLSSKFGAPPDDVPGLLEALSKRGAEPALAFNVGSSVIDPAAYRHAMGVAGHVLARLPFRVRLLDIGGGFPRSYPGFQVPLLTAYFSAIAEAGRELPLREGGTLLAEPGRALAAPGLSVLTEVLLRKQDRLYLNDGMFGIFWELRFKGHKRYPARCWRNGRVYQGPVRPFQLYGPTCDATDILPGRVDLPVDVTAGDIIEFGNIGAYSLSGRTHFNGFYSDRVVRLQNPAARPPS